MIGKKLLGPFSHRNVHTMHIFLIDLFLYIGSLLAVCLICLTSHRRLNLAIDRNHLIQCFQHHLAVDAEAAS